MHNSIGTDKTTLVLEAIAAVNLAFAISSAYPKRPNGYAVLSAFSACSAVP